MIRPAGIGALESTRLLPTYREDLRTGPPARLVECDEAQWSTLTWKQLGRPYQVENISPRRRDWEQDAGHPMPVEIQWEQFNRHFHTLFTADPKACNPALRRRFLNHLARLQLPGAGAVLRELLQIQVWNYVHRIQDAVWDPRGKRALFGGLNLTRPRILFLGAADGYEGMQLQALYPGGHTVLVDYDAFCRDHRFGEFPEAYPFLGSDPATGNLAVYRKSDFSIDFVVEDLRNLDFGAEFDIVISVGLVEHFPDEFKAVAFDAHRRFLKPGGTAIFTTPRLQLRSRLFYRIMGDLMNFGYRELMTTRQLGLYVWENGFDILRAGQLQAHNAIIAKPR